MVLPPTDQQVASDSNSSGNKASSSSSYRKRLRTVSQHTMTTNDENVDNNHTNCSSSNTLPHFNNDIFMNQMMQMFSELFSKNGGDENLIAFIDRKMTCIIQLLQELKGIVTRTTPSTNQPNENVTTMETERSTPICSEQEQKSKLVSLSIVRKNVFHMIVRNQAIAEVYAENINLPDPLIPRKLFVSITAYDKPKLIEYKKARSVKNVHDEREHICVIKEGQIETLAKIDEEVIQIILNDERLQTFWNDTIKRMKPI